MLGGMDDDIRPNSGMLVNDWYDSTHTYVDVFLKTGPSGAGTLVQTRGPRGVFMGKPREEVQQALQATGFRSCQTGVARVRAALPGQARREGGSGVLHQEPPSAAERSFTGRAPTGAAYAKPCIAQ